MQATAAAIYEQPVAIPDRGRKVVGSLAVPLLPRGTVVLARGSADQRPSVRQQMMLFDSGFATLIIELLAFAEEAEDRGARRFTCDLGLLAERLMTAVDWLSQDEDEHLPRDVRDIPVGLCAAGTAAAAALVVAAHRRSLIAAVVSRSGDLDLAADALSQVLAPTLMIAAGDDARGIELGRHAQALLAGESQVEIVPGTGPALDDPGAAERVATLTRDWFVRYVRDDGQLADIRDAEEAYLSGRRLAPAGQSRSSSIRSATESITRDGR